MCRIQHSVIKKKGGGNTRKNIINGTDLCLFSLNENAGRLLRSLRCQLGISGEELGGIIGLSQQQVSRYERGESELTLGQLQRFSEALNMSIWEFVGKLYLIFYLDKENNTGEVYASDMYTAKNGGGL